MSFGRAASTINALARRTFRGSDEQEVRAAAHEALNQALPAALRASDRTGDPSARWDHAWQRLKIASLRRDDCWHSMDMGFAVYADRRRHRIGNDEDLLRVLPTARIGGVGSRALLQPTFDELGGA